MDTGPVIEAKYLVFRYGGGESTFHLRVPRLSVARGEHVGIVGASGSGKTTLLHMFAGILTPEAGRMSVLGADMRSIGERGARELRLHRMGLVFQEFELLAYLDVSQNIMLAQRLGVANLARDRMQYLASAAGIAHLLKRKPARLSQGERQRVAVCRALLHEPLLVLCDEPTGNLDPLTTERITELLQSEVRKIGGTMIMVSHNHGALRGFTRIVAMEDLARRAGEVP